jgi:thioredoxin reductase
MNIYDVIIIGSSPAAIFCAGNICDSIYKQAITSGSGCM